MSHNIHLQSKLDDMHKGLSNLFPQYTKSVEYDMFVCYIENTYKVSKVFVSKIVISPFFLDLRLN